MLKATNEMREKLRDQRNKKKCEKRVQEDEADIEKLRIVAIKRLTTK